MAVLSRTAAALFCGGLLMVPGPTVLTAQPGPVVLNVNVWDGRRAMGREAMLEVVEFASPDLRVGHPVPVLADWPTEVRHDQRVNTASVRTPPLEVGVRYRMRLWLQGARGYATEIPLAVTAAMCPRGCERDAVFLELEPGGRTVARGTPVLAATGSPEVGTTVIAGPFSPHRRTRR